MVSKRELFVYLIESTTGLSKIGYASNLTNRLATLQVGSPVQLTMTAFCKMPDREAKLVEKDLHLLFREQRHHGEWFQLDSVQLESVKQHLRQLSLQDARPLPSLQLRHHTALFQYELSQRPRV